MSKKVRTRKRGGGTSKNSQNLMLAGGFAALIIAVVVFVNLQSTPEVGEKISDMGNRHIAKPDSFIWNSNPPTSGPHGDLGPWGIQEESMHPWNFVHNMEDGGVIIHYNCPEGCPEVVAELEALYFAAGPEKLILHPYTDMEHKIALTAWTRLLELDEVDEDQIMDFITAYRGIDHH